MAVCLVGAVAAVVIAVAAPSLEDALLVLALVLVRLTLVVRPYTTNNFSEVKSLLLTPVSYVLAFSSVKVQQ